MAYYNASFLFLIAFILFATPNPLAEGTIIPQRLVVNGTLCCTPTGNCPGQGVNGALVRLNCTNLLGVFATVGQSTTNVDGTFTIDVRNPIGLLALNQPILPCVATVQLPLGQCPALSTANGTLVGVVRNLGIVVRGILDTILLGTVPGFIQVTVS